MFMFVIVLDITLFLSMLPTLFFDRLSLDETVTSLSYKIITDFTLEPLPYNDSNDLDLLNDLSKLSSL